MDLLLHLPLPGVFMSKPQVARLVRETPPEAWRTPEIYPVVVSTGDDGCVIRQSAAAFQTGWSEENLGKTFDPRTGRYDSAWTLNL